MASVVVPRSNHLLSAVAGGLLLVTIIAISFTAVADSARDEPPPTTAAKPIKIEVYPGCSKTLLPKRCSFRLAKLIKILGDTKALIAGPLLGAPKLKTDSCITECTKVLDETMSKADAGKADEEALKALKGYLYDTAINNYGPIGPCECNCPEPCTPAEAADVKALGDATGSMRDLGNQLKSLFERGEEGEEDDNEISEGEKAEAARMEKSIDSGVLHASCGLTKEPQKCIDELAALATATKDANTGMTWYLEHKPVVKPETVLDSVILECRSVTEKVDLEIYATEGQVKNLAELRDALRSYVNGDGKKPPVCTYSCPPPPPEKPCSVNETAIVDKLTGIHNAWAAGEKVLTELLTPTVYAANKVDA